MAVWKPEPGERYLARVPVCFATGRARRVRGMRWFRDSDRRDIGGELTGWPAGPEFTVRASTDALWRSGLRGIAQAAGAVVLGVLTSQGGSVGGGSAVRRGSGTPQEPADEVEDFPVLWAPPGTVARTLPWQLDPGRRDAKRYTTHAIITDRRWVIVGLPLNEKNAWAVEDEVLWEGPRRDLRRVEPRDFTTGDDVKIVFDDGSWCRLEVRTRPRVTRYLDPDLELLPLASLSPAHREQAREFEAESGCGPGSSFVTRNACGCLRIATVDGARVSSWSGIADTEIIVDADGTRLGPQEFHPADFFT
ncbi:hypothetical protein [Streptomyces albidoflavus]|uniref:hypothetical protein n=1 Tax=Streptomyces albidoflavus TaxID=1886 RepID=UPI00101E53A5|nr:hypothetical protein [Streptomyces albidoflavus]RZD87965.1 hypothetical protein C0Q63_10410 [Streptomyces albidoflavus]